MSSPEIQSFLISVRSRIAGGTRKAIIAKVLLGIAGAAVVWALAWRAFGYAAPIMGYAVIAAVGLLAGVFWMIASRRGLRDAAHVADRQFSLKDGLVSWMDFKEAGLDGEVYQLNERDLAKQVASLDPQQIPQASQRRNFGLAALLTVVAAVLAMIPHSASVRDRLAREELTASRSAEIEKQVEEAIEEIIKGMTPEEREVIKPESLREWAKEMQVTKDMRENEKQLARLEQQIAKAMQGLEARQDEAVLKLAAEELSKSSLADVRQLGKKLEAKDFEKAAADLKDMKPGVNKKMTPEELEKLLKNAAKTRDMAKRMADGARKRDFGNMKPGNNKNAKPGKEGGEDAQAMEEMLEPLEEDANELAEELEDGEEPGDEEMELGDRLGGKMDGLGKRLGKLGARQKARNKLDALRRGLGGARQFAQGKASSLGLAAAAARSNQPGGREPGKGSDSTRRNQQDEFKDNGNLAEIKGNQNNEGPATNTVESAESGSGVAGRANVAKQREFKQQLESLVRRDDIPEALKLGVREYFENVHETAPEK